MPPDATLDTSAYADAVFADQAYAGYVLNFDVVPRKFWLDEDSITNGWVEEASSTDSWSEEVAVPDGWTGEVEEGP